MGKTYRRGRPSSGQPRIINDNDVLRSGGREPRVYGDRVAYSHETFASSRYAKVRRNRLERRVGKRVARDGWR